MRTIGLDVHRHIAEIAILQGKEEHRLRIATEPEALRDFAQTLGPEDQVVLEATANTWPIRLHAGMTRRGLRTKKGKPFSVSKLAETLQHDVYAGMVTWGGERHQGIHDPLVSMETFARVQKIFRAHDKAGPRIGVHTTSLNGSLVCATCGSKLSVTLAKGRFPYFFCQGRTRQGKDCRERYVPVGGIQRQVEGIYRQIRLSDEGKRQLAKKLEREIDAQEGGRAKEAARIARRVAQLEIERTKLLRAYYDDAISVDLLKAEQRRIEAETLEIKTQVNMGKAGIEKARAVLDQALTFLDNCRAAYQDAGDDLRRLWNRAIFKAIYVGDGLVAGFEYHEFFGALLSEADSGSKTVRSGSP